MITAQHTSEFLRQRTDDSPRTSAAEAALSRRSVRKFTETPVSEALIQELLTLVGRAPSAFNVQPWRFVVVRDPALRQALQGAAYNQPQVGNAPIVIAIYSDMEDAVAHVEEIVNPGLDAAKTADTVAMLRRTFGGMTNEERASWGNAQSNIALGYLLLLAETEGLATSPMLGFQPDQVKDILGIPASATVTALIALGWPDEEGYASYRHDIQRVASFR